MSRRLIICLVGGFALILILAIASRRPLSVEQLLAMGGPDFLCMKFSGQQRELSVTDKHTLDYLKACFRQHRAGVKGGFTYSLRIQTGKFYRDVKTTVYIPSDNTGISIEIPTLESDIGLQDPTYVFATFPTPIPDSVKRLLNFLTGDQFIQKKEVIDEGNARK